MGGRPSVMGHRFSQVPDIRVERSTFNRSHGIKTTFDAGKLVPIYVDEVLPGDTFNCRMNFFARLSTPLKPIMDNVFAETFYFFVPLRLLWTNFQKFMGEQLNPGDSISYTVPTVPMPAGGPEVGDLFDAFGLPTDIAASYSVAAFHSRAYNLIWNHWFRDENLQNALTVDTGDGPDTFTNYNTLRRRGKRHDYFTSCLPWPQKGATAQSLPLGTSAPVLGIGMKTQGYDPADVTAYEASGTTRVYDQHKIVGDSTVDTNKQIYIEKKVGSDYPNIYADLSAATAATINQLRQAMLYQAFLERDARGGTRYTEIIRSQFGVTSPDHRMQRPEFLGGGSSAVNIHPVPMTGQTNGAAADDQQGNLAAFGTVSGINHGFVKSFTEHGVIIGLINVRADLTYQQGVERMWSRSTRYDFGWPILAGLGEQPVYNREIYVQGTGDDALVFGYQGRYDEYRYKPSRICGAFRSTYATNLDEWHLSKQFTALPVLNDAFIQDTCDTEIDRAIAVPSEPQILFDGYINLTCARALPVYGVPGMGARL